MTYPANKPFPERIGKYEIISVLGQGGMGVVYHARNPRIGMDVAIKTLTESSPNELNPLARFYDEAGQTARLRHPNIVTVYDFGDEDGQPYIVMEYLDGDPLDRLIREKHPRHLGIKLDIIAQVCTALAYAHQQGMIHRDVKPANVIVQRDGPVKLLDFGIAKGREAHIDQSHTSAGSMVGTPSYIAPERWLQEPFDGRSDIFSAGVLLYQLVTWSLPFDAKYPDIIQHILKDPTPLLSDILQSCPPKLERVIERALAKKPANRYQQADEMASDLMELAGQLKSEHVAELLTQSRQAVDADDYARARQILSQAQRLDSQNTEAKKLVAQVDEKLNLEKARQRVAQLHGGAQEALTARNWDQAQTLISEALQLDEGNAELEKLLAEATAGKERMLQIQQYLRGAESARAGGDLDRARELAGKAADLDPADSRIMAICKVLEQEAAERRRKAKLRELLQNAQALLTANRMAEAAAALAEAEAMEPADADLLRLKDDLAAAKHLAERKRLVVELDERAAVASTLEQLQAVSDRLAEALTTYPTEPTLIRLRLQLVPRLKEHQDRQLIADVSNNCKNLPPVDAIVRIREALAQLPGNAELIRLEAAFAQRLTREQREQRLAEYLARARVLLDDHLYIETAKTLEQCEREGFSSPELTELLELSRSTAATRVSQDLIERSFLEAKRLMEEQNYEGIIEMMPSVLDRVDEPSLRRLLEEATAKQKEQETKIDALTVSAHQLGELGLYDAAIGMLMAESAPLRASRRIQEALGGLTTMLESDSARMESMGAVYAAIGSAAAPQALKRLAAPTDGMKVIAAEVEERLTSRLRLQAEDRVRKSIEEARRAIESDDGAQVEEAIAAGSPWLELAGEKLKTDWANLQSQVVASRKVLRFRKASRR